MGLLAESAVIAAFKRRIAKPGGDARAEAAIDGEPEDKTTDRGREIDRRTPEENESEHKAKKGERQREAQEEVDRKAAGRAERGHRTKETEERQETQEETIRKDSGEAEGECNAQKGEEQRKAREEIDRRAVEGTVCECRAKKDEEKKGAQEGADRKVAEGNKRQCIAKKGEEDEGTEAHQSMAQAGAFVNAVMKNKESDDGRQVGRGCRYDALGQEAQALWAVGGKSRPGQRRQGRMAELEGRCEAHGLGQKPKQTRGRVGAVPVP